MSSTRSSARRWPDIVPRSRRRTHVGPKIGWRTDGLAAGVAAQHQRAAPSYASYPFGAPPCRIYRPSPSVMQSGGRRARPWVLEFEPIGESWAEPLMGWTATGDPFGPIRLTFPTRAAAVDYAEREALDYAVIEPDVHRPVRKSYRETIAGPAR